MKTIKAFSNEEPKRVEDLGLGVVAVRSNIKKVEIDEYSYDEIQVKSTVDNVLYKLKEMLISEISDYDKSDNVNQFSIAGVDMWLPQDKRVGLMLRIQAEEAALKETTTLWWDGNEFTFRIADLKNALLAVESYASACFDATARMKNEVAELDDIEAVINYDYRNGYPEKLSL